MHDRVARRLCEIATVERAHIVHVLYTPTPSFQTSTWKATCGHAYISPPHAHLRITHKAKRKKVKAKKQIERQTERFVTYRRN